MLDSLPGRRTTGECCAGSTPRITTRRSSSWCAGASHCDTAAASRAASGRSSFRKTPAARWDLFRDELTFDSDENTIPTGCARPPYAPSHRTAR